MRNNGEGRFGDEPDMPFAPHLCRASKQGHSGQYCFG